MTSAIHRIEPRLLDKRVTIHLAGVGGNGAQMASCLARLDIAIRALGHPHGLFVHAFAPDVVTESNVGRQLFSPADIGASKAVVTITRLNHFYGLDWDASICRIEEHWNRATVGRSYDGNILISCVDSRAARRAIHEHLFACERYCYWLDLGNGESEGQVVLGTPRIKQGHASDQNGERLPCVTELYRDLLNPKADDEDIPSCSVRLSLASQGLFVNDIVVRHAAQLLYQLFSCGQLTVHGVYCNLKAQRSAPLMIDPDTWRRINGDA